MLLFLFVILLVTDLTEEKSSDPQCNRLTSKRSSSSEKEISSRITKRFKKSLNLLHNEPSCHSETPNRKPAESSATKTGSIADYKSKVLRRQVFEKNHYGETSLHRAAKQKDVDLLYRLIKIGAEVNRADNAGWTPLHEACVFGNYNAAKCLLEAGADVNATGFGQVAPIHDAVYEGDYEVNKQIGFGIQIPSMWMISNKRDLQ
uniref:Uncharacterized protein n=1 Tax=Leptobrachium leishanense TaxID=445787 RepID=A0A8C5LN95_9ANUR